MTDKQLKQIEFLKEQALGIADVIDHWLRNELFLVDTVEEFTEELQPEIECLGFEFADLKKMK